MGWLAILVNKLIVSGHNPPSQLESKARGFHSNMCSAYGCNCHNSAVTLCIKIIGNPLIVQTCMWPAAKLPVVTKPSWGTQLTSYTWQRALFPLDSKHNRGKIWFICLRIQLEQELATCTTLLLTVKLPSSSLCQQTSTCCLVHLCQLSGSALVKQPCPAHAHS